MKKIKQSIALILCLALLLSWTSATSLAEEESSAGEEISGTTEDGFVWKLWENEEGANQNDKIGERVRIIGYTGEKGEITIPLEIEGYQVSGILSHAFWNDETITDVTIPEGIIGIGYRAFDGCPNLRRVSIPSTILRWSDSEGAQGAMQTVNPRTFQNCTALEEVILAEGIPALGEYMFEGCSSLKKIKVPDSVDISKGLKQIFIGASGLEEVELPEGMTLIGERAFEGTGFKSFVVPDGVTEISAYAFYNCANLTTVKIPDSVTIIGRSVFEGTSLEHVNLPKGVTSLGYTVFGGCTSLKSVSLPAENIGWIPADAFPAGITVYLTPGSKTEATVKSMGTVTVADITEHPDHEYETVVTKEPTCEENGIETSTCRICGAVNETGIPATGHSYGNWTKGAEATCTKAGSESRTCTICKKKETKVIPAKGHQYEITKVVPSTTKAEGYTLKTCKVCHTQTKDQITPKLESIKKASLKKLASPKKGTIKVQWKKLSGVTGYQIQIGTNKKVTKNRKVINIKKAKTVKKTIKKLKSGKKYYVKIRGYQTIDGKKIYGAWSQAKRVKVK